MRGRGISKIIGKHSVDSAPYFDIAPGEASVEAAGGTVQFVAISNSSAFVTYSLVSPPSNASINSDGLVEFTAFDSSYGNNWFDLLTSTYNSWEDNVLYDSFSGFTLTVRAANTFSYNEHTCDITIIIGNRYPSIIGFPAELTLTAGTRYDIDISPYASDPDGDTLIYSLANPSYSGISINQTTGILTLLADVSSGDFSLILRVTDAAGLSFDWSVNISMITGASSLDFPRLSAYWIGNNAALGGQTQQYLTPQGITMMAKRDFVVINSWPELEAGGGNAKQAIATAVKSVSVKNTKIAVYFDTERCYKTRITRITRYDKITSMNWHVYESGTTGTPLDSYFSSDGWAINPTTYVPRDAQNRTAMEWMADYEPTWIVGGAENNALAPSIDGWFWDNCLIGPKIRGDWNRDGTADLVNPPSNYYSTEYYAGSATQQWYREGITTGINRCRQNYPTKLQLGNLSAFIKFTSTPFPQYGGVLDGGCFEGAIGISWSPETWMSTAEYVQKLGFLAANVRDEKLVAFNCQPDNLSATNWQAFRHSFAMCAVVTNFALDYTREIDYLRYYDDYDEYNFNLGKPLATAAGAKQVAATQNGIWRRDFDNGIVLWCPKGISGNIDLGGTFQRLAGTQDTVTNNGQSVTSVTFGTNTIPYWSGGSLTNMSVAGRDGLVLRRPPSTTRRILYTNFAGPLVWNWPVYAGYIPSTWPPPNTVISASTSEYALGDWGYLTGTDSTTGQVFSRTSPQLWSGYDSGKAWNCSLCHGVLAGGASRWNAEARFLSPSQVIGKTGSAGYEFISGIAGPPGTNITTACKPRYLSTTYRQPEQAGLTFYPNTNLSQGIVYHRCWFKLQPGFWNCFDWFRSLCTWKGDNNVNRGVMAFVKDDGIAQHRIEYRLDVLGDTGPGPWTFSNVTNRCAWSDGYGTHQFYAWDSINYGNGQTGYAYSPVLAEDTWYKLEVASFASVSTGGFLWAALDGVVFCNYRGQTFFDGTTTKMDRYDLMQTYSNVNTTDAGYLLTGLEVWEGWAPDATAHPGI